ncbi:hypothetical protein EAH86_18135 [Pedococcus bigeumensis]|uniref:Uncharacterized protein n=1 Tax=Pedococcus bigeumensis TaxID=433644 RepID=A0A502CNP5_9MICO|nr:hypothetical protein EAH86_18135 [Pedococcus bigeumensis]
MVAMSPEIGGAASVEPPVVEDRGSFSHAVCRVCGWSGPGRRSRRVSREDSRAHQETCPGRQPSAQEG